MERKRIRILAFFLCFVMLFSQSTHAAGFDTETEASTTPVQLNLPCKSAMLIEETTGQVLYEKNADEKLPIASVTKIMTLLLVMEALDAGTVSLDQDVPISEYAASMGGSQAYLEVGEKISLNDVLKAVFVSSANDGAVALAELISGSVDGFVARMNERANELGMHNSIFFNPTGLDDEETNLSTARDVALMSAALLSHEEIYQYTKIWIDSIRNGAFGLSNTNKLIRFYPGATGLKTGSTAKAKYCVSASAERAGLKLCAVVLAGETSADRFTSAKTLLDYGFAQWAFFSPEDAAIEPIPVWGGQEKSVSVATDQGGFLLPKADSVGIVPEITVAENLTAPVEKGQTVGSIQYKKDGRVVHEKKLYAEKEVPALSFWDVFLSVLNTLFFGRAA